MFQLLAVCPMGLEAVVAKEIQDLGYENSGRKRAYIL